MPSIEEAVHEERIFVLSAFSDEKVFTIEAINITLQILKAIQTRPNFSCSFRQDLFQCKNPRSCPISAIFYDLAEI
jgi:hypothetical protein